MILLLTFNTARLSVLADWMVILTLFEDVPDLLTALAVCVPDDSSIVEPVVSSVELYVAASVEHGDDDDPHDVDVDPPVLFTYKAFAEAPPPPLEFVGQVLPDL